MADFKLTVGEHEYVFAPEMLTQSRLSQVKQWYGKELGRYNNFIEAFFEGDPDAAKCAVWVARKAAGEPSPPEPNQMEDFSLAQWIKPGETAVEDESEANPTELPPTLDTTETPTNSSDDTSGKSPTSSSGAPETSESFGGLTS
jgi:hypothetical protein